MRLRDLSLFLLIGVFLFAGELALEFRANRRGFDTLLLGRARSEVDVGREKDGFGGRHTRR